MNQDFNNSPTAADPELEPQPSSPVAPDRQTRQLSRPVGVFLIALALAIFTDVIVYRQPLGAQWAIFVLILLVGSFAAVIIEGQRPGWQSWPLAVLVGLAVGLTAFRSEGFTLFTLVVFSMAGLILLAISLVSGQWPALRFREYFTGFFRFIGAVLSGIFLSLVQVFSQRDKKPVAVAEGKRTGKGKAVLSGLLIALPLLVVFSLLLSSADMVFSQRFKALFGGIRLDNWQDILSQLILIAFFTYLLFGYIRAAVLLGAEKAAVEPDAALIKPFLGFTESAIVLGSLNLLFAAFLLIQFRYFFAGEANITAAGFTYADYARRGFFELIAVAVLSSLVIFALASLSKRGRKSGNTLFTILETVLVLQVGVMLISAFQRLSLYEAAYGFTQARLVAHIAIFFLAAFLLVLLILEYSRNFKRLAFAVLLFFAAFALTLAVVNVDDTVTRNNLNHAMQGNDLDLPYLAYSVGDDAVPALFSALADPATPSNMKDGLGLVLACRAARFENDLEEEKSWPSWHASRARAQKLYASNASLLAQYPLEDFDGDQGFTFEGQQYYCTFSEAFD